MSSTPGGSGLIVPGGSPQERIQHRLHNLEAPAQEAWRSETPWTTLSYQNGASTVGGAVAAAYRRTGDGFVIVRGYVSAALGGVPVCTLPAGFRPASGTKRWAAGGNIGGAALDVDTSGQIIPFAAGFPTSVGLDPIIFYIGS